MSINLEPTKNHSSLQEVTFHFPWPNFRSEYRAPRLRRIVPEGEERENPGRESELVKSNRRDGEFVDEMAPKYYNRKPPFVHLHGESYRRDSRRGNCQFLVAGNSNVCRVTRDSHINQGY